MTSLSDYMGDVDVFKSILQVSQFPFLQTEDDAETLNALLKYKHGCKPLNEHTLGISSVVIGRMMVTELSGRWDAMVERELTIETGNTRVIDEVVGETTDSTSNENKVKSISAFNSPTLIEDGADSGTSSSQMGRDVTKQTTDTRVYANDKFRQLSELVKQSIINTVIADVSNFLTTKVY